MLGQIASPVTVNVTTSAQGSRSGSQRSLPAVSRLWHHAQSHAKVSGRQRGDKIAGRYEVLSVNSHKGSTTFYTARAQGGRKVAVKALSLQNMAKWDELEAFERESRALRALTHARSANTAIPSFVEVFEEDDRDRTFYLVQELVEGPTMAQRLAQGWRASPSTLQRLTTQLTQALQDLSQATGTGFQGLAQQVMQMGRNARSSLQAGPGRSRQQASVPAAEGRRSQPQGNGLPAAVLGLAAATLFLGPGLPMFLFSILPFLAAGSSPPRYALAGSPCPPRPSMGFQNAPGRYVSPMQQQQMLRMMLAQQAQQQRLQSARSMQLLSSRQLQQRQRGQQMWGGFF
ncbi:hypothetical protein WJX84_005905 [Apatococcus fuscideae]|uniref:Protein kinase domain-containing protein n=1 Tax=Apatococcus fuscideae TaxID=2026836 RepID=A0AAW1T696_9CHLO